MIEFSIPLFFYEDFFIRVMQLNKITKKNKITSVYGCFPANIENSCGFEQIRVNEYPNVKTVEDFFLHVKKAQEIGLEFIYLLNTPKTMLPAEFIQGLENCNRFIELLLSNNIKRIRVTNTQLIEHITKKYPEIEIRTSTSQEYTSIRQYRNLFTRFPNITEIIPSWDMNKNFTFLRNFRMSFDKKIELMANEGCLPGCPFRTHHALHVPTGRESEKRIMVDIPTDYADCFTQMCADIYFKNPWRNIMLSNIIYPWEIESYAKKYGITKFKLVGRNLLSKNYINGDYFELFNVFIRGVEDYDFIANMKFKYFNMYLAGCDFHPNFNLTVSEVREYLPSLSYFEKNGSKCASVCGEECKYCFTLAEKINSKYPF